MTTLFKHDKSAKNYQLAPRRKKICSPSAQELLELVYDLCDRRNCNDILLTTQQIEKLTQESRSTMDRTRAGMSRETSIKARRELECLKFIKAEKLKYGYRFVPLNEDACPYDARPERERRKNVVGKGRSKLTPEESQRHFEKQLGLSLDVRDEGQAVNVRCPLHDDSTASLSINITGGVFNCFGCGQSGNNFEFERLLHGGTIQQAYFRVGKVLEVADLRARVPDSEKIHNHFVDESGVTLYTQTRVPTVNDRGEVGKKFVLSHKREENGKLVRKNHIHGVRKVLWNLPDVLKARTVIIAEGVKDARSINALGLLDCTGTPVVATSNVEGATTGGNAGWLPEYTRTLADKYVILVPDTDAPTSRNPAFGGVGVERVKKIEHALTGHARSITTVYLYSGSETGDATEFLETHSADDLVRKLGNGIYVKRNEPTPEEDDPWVKFDITQTHDVGFAIAQGRCGENWCAICSRIDFSSGWDAYDAFWNVSCTRNPYSKTLDTGWTNNLDSEWGDDNPYAGPEKLKLYIGFCHPYELDRYDEAMIKAERNAIRLEYPPEF